MKIVCDGSGGIYRVVSYLKERIDEQSKKKCKINYQVIKLHKNQLTLGYRKDFTFYKDTVF